MAEKRSILFISQDFPPEIGGIHTYSAELANNLSALGHKVTVIAPEKSEAALFDEKQPYSVIRIRSSNSLLGLKLIIQIRSIIRTHKPDCIFHAQWNSLAASYVARVFGYHGPIFCAAHARELLLEPSLPILNSLFRIYRTLLMRLPAVYYPVSVYTQKVLLRLGIGLHNTQIINNGTDPVFFSPDVASGQEFRKTHAIPKNAFVLSTTARLVQRKGVGIVIEAVERLKEKIPCLVYIIAGDGPEKQNLQSQINRISNAGSIRLIGKVPFQNLPALYNASNVFVMVPQTIPPDVEGFGIVYLEANACSLPVIASDSGGVPDAVLHMETGIIVREGDTKELADAILFLFQNPDRGKKMGHLGRRRVLDELNWRNTAQKLSNSIQHYNQ
ncbi:MAG: glycosyltransferase family 4 protein [Balneolales bacterium]|nr:glycosyltransferase family 4 protein [Balneolales bacterium]